jgi:hypothetical protein
MANRNGLRRSFTRQSSKLWQSIAAALTGLLVCSGASEAAAQVPLDQFRSAPLPSDGFALSRPETLGNLAWAASLALDYAAHPLAYRLDQQEGEVGVVDHQLAAHVGAALGLGDRFTLYGVLPVNLLMTGDDLAGRVPNADGAGLGDLALGGRLLLTDGARFGLSGEFTARLPSAQVTNADQHYSGDQIGSYEPALVGELRVGRLDLRARPGLRLRQPTRVGNLGFSHELVYGAGARVRVTAALSAHLEAYGCTPFSQFAGRELSPFEVLLGAKYQHEAWVFGAAVGPGLSQGYGSPDVRAVLTLGFLSASKSD